MKTTQERRLKKLEDEEWLPVPDTDNKYLISNYGRLKSFIIDKTEGQILKCAPVKGFKVGQITTSKGRERFYIHKLTAEVWLPRPSNEHVHVTHKDGNRANNHISNLKWVTRDYLLKIFAESSRLATKNGPPRNSKLNERDVQLLKSMIERGVTQAKIAKLFRISEMQVTRIKRGENWGHVSPDPEP